MDLTIGEKTVGNIYFVIRLELESLGISKAQLADDIKEQKFKVTFHDHEFILKSYRRMYVQDGFVNLEGAELI